MAMSIDETNGRNYGGLSKKGPFAWVKRLASRKNVSEGKSLRSTGRKLSPGKMKRAVKRDLSPQSDPASTKDGSPKKKNEGKAPAQSDGHIYDPLADGNCAENGVERDLQPVGASNRSTAPTLDTTAGTVYSEAGQSKAETTNTTAGAMSSNSGEPNSVFSSPNPSSRSLTTTLTTIQSTTPSAAVNQATTGVAANTNAPVVAGHHASSHHQHQGSQGSNYFTHQYPVTPASAVPPHLVPGTSHVPMTYRSAIAHNLLTDNASVLTLASSTNRRHNRRNSVDTDASIRAIAPASLWGGSRESLPLSVLSKDGDAAGPSGAASIAPSGVASQSRPSISGIAGVLPGSGPSSATEATRAPSVYSTTGVNAPALNSERNSIYAGRTATNSPTTSSPQTGLPAPIVITAPGSSGPPDGVSVASTKSGVIGHNRGESVAASVVSSSPLVATTSYAGADGADEKGDEKEDVIDSEGSSKHHRGGASTP